MAVLRSLGVWPQVESLAYPLTSACLTGRGRRKVTVALHGSTLFVVAPRQLETVLLRAAHEAGLTEAPAGSEPGLRIVDEPPQVDFHAPVVVEGRFAAAAYEPHVLDLFLGGNGSEEGWVVPEGEGTVLVGLLISAPDRTAAIAGFERWVEQRLRMRLTSAHRLGEPVVRMLPPPTTIHPSALIVRPVDPVPRLLCDCGIDLTLATGLLAGDQAAGVLEKSASARDVAESYGRRARWLSLPSDGIRWAESVVRRTQLANAAITVASLPLLRRLVR